MLECDFLCGSPRIRSLDLTDESEVSHPSQWLHVVTHPSIADIRELRVYSHERPGAVTTEALEAVCCLAQIHTLVICPDHATSKQVEWSLLSQLQRLTSLEICNVDGLAVAPQLAAISRCSALRELRLVRFTQPLIALFESLSPLPHLRVLLFGRGCNDKAEPELHLDSRFRAACARMQSLEDLQFSASQMLHQSLPYLVECKSLRSLSHRFDIGAVCPLTAAVYCSPQLAASLSALPQCQFSLQMVVHCNVRQFRAMDQVKSFQRTFDKYCAGERANQARANVPLTPTDVADRIRAVRIGLRLMLAQHAAMSTIASKPHLLCKQGPRRSLVQLELALHSTLAASLNQRSDTTRLISKEVQQRDNGKDRVRFRDLAERSARIRLCPSVAPYAHFP